MATTVKDASAALRATQVRLEDARIGERDAAKVRTDKETEVSEGRAAVVAARAAWLPDRTNEKLHNRVLHAERIVVELEKEAAEAATAHEQARAEVQNRTAGVSAAEGVLRLAEAAERRADRNADLRKLGAQVLKAQLDAAALATRAQAMLEDDAADAALLGEQPSDALPVAQGIAEAIVEAGGNIWGQTDVVRWASHKLLRSAVSFETPLARMHTFLASVAQLTKTVLQPGSVPQSDAGERKQVAAWTGWYSFPEYTYARDAADADARIAHHLRGTGAKEIARLAAQDKVKRSTPGLIGIAGREQYGNEPPPPDHDPAAAEKARVEGMGGLATVRNLGKRLIGIQ